MPKPYRLALDVGATSIGWTALELHPVNLEPCGVLRMGVRLFSSGRDLQTYTSLAMGRRLARAARRRRDRFLQRQQRLAGVLVRLGLLPADLAERKRLEPLDPYSLRQEALERALTPWELGRLLWHINRRRGFRSSRKTQKEPNESGKIATGIEALKAQIVADGARTLGEWLARRHADKEWVRARLSGSGAKASYPFYPSRALLEAEFDCICEAQAPHRPELSAEDWTAIRNRIFWQRSLRPVDPGRCTLNPAEPRMAWAYPAAQRFRIAQEVANLRIVDRHMRKHTLSPQQRQSLMQRLQSGETLPFKKIAVLLGLSDGQTLNLQSEKRIELAGDATAAALGQRKRFGKLWQGLSDADRHEVVQRSLELETEEDETHHSAWLQERFGLTTEAAASATACSPIDGYCRLGATAIADLLPFMEEQGMDYAQAAVAAGYHHSDLRAEGNAALPRLPFYAEVREMERFLSFGSGDANERDPFRRVGRIANPTVHIGLNQSRAVVNDLIAEYGRPHSIVVELARDLSRSAEDKRRIQREQFDNQRKNDSRKAQLKELGQSVTAQNIMLLRLWEELPGEGLVRQCVYTGETIGIGRLFGGDIDIDHILPYSRTLDDSPANRLVCVRNANKQKRNLSPFEAFGSHPRLGFDWTDILDRARRLPPNKRWRFEPEAMARYDDTAQFLDRHLNDTRYLSRLARLYLGCLYDLRSEGERVSAVPGTLIGLLRRKWGLNDLLSVDGEKNRDDHRHHAIDAAVIAVLDKSVLDAVQRAAKSSEDQHLERLLGELAPRYNWFREEVEAQVAHVVVSVRPDHGVAGRLHEDTNYGLAAPAENADGHTLVYRKALEALSLKEVGNIRDPALRHALGEHIAAHGVAGKDMKLALASFAQRPGPWQHMRHVRLLKKEAQFETIRHGRNGEHRRTLVPGNNLCIDIVQTDKGRWAGHAITVLAGNRLARQGDTDLRLAAPGPHVAMRLFKGDLIRMRLGGEANAPMEVMRVWGLDIAAGRLRLAPHKEGGELDKRHDSPEDRFRWTFASFDVLRRRDARKVTVTPSGRLRDPGPIPPRTQVE